MRLLIMALLLLVPIKTFGGDPVFQYQGKVRVQGTPFTGTGHFKFAIVSESGNRTLWSTDGTSTNGNEPTGPGIAIPVTDGVFNALIGDTGSGQQPIPPTVLRSRDDLKLRTWFNNGSIGFQRLNPDAKLINLSLRLEETGTTDIVLYVDAVSGDDGNNGLTTATAKKTIQAAVNVIPSRVNSNITVKILPGVYPEMVSIRGISCIEDKFISFIGDEVWTPGSVGSPSVVISGSDEPSTVPLRRYGVTCQFGGNIKFQGLEFRNALEGGLIMRSGTYTVTNCLARNNSNSGIIVADRGLLEVSNAHASGNSRHGFYTQSSRMLATSCSATLNAAGFYAEHGSELTFSSKIQATNNTSNGIQVWNSSYVYFSNGLTGSISNNGAYGLQLAYNSYANNYNAIVGITVSIAGNVAGGLNTIYGGIKNW